MMAETALAGEKTTFSKNYSQNGRSVPCKFEDHLKINFRDWMIIQTLLYCLSPFRPNIASVGRSIVD